MSEAASILAASPILANAGQSTEQEDEVVVSTAGASQQPVSTRAPAPIFDNNGADYDVPQETIDAIESFVVPSGYQREGAREESFLGGSAATIPSSPAAFQSKGSTQE